MSPLASGRDPWSSVQKGRSTFSSASRRAGRSLPGLWGQLPSQSGAHQCPAGILQNPVSGGFGNCPVLKGGGRT